MHMRKLVIVLVALVAPIAGIQPAQAQDNPNLLDSGGLFVQLDVTNPSALGHIRLEEATSPDIHQTAGAQEFRTSGFDSASLTLIAYEPDKVTRKLNSAKIQQKSALLAAANYFTGGGNATATNIAPLCGGKVTMKDANLDATPDTLKWKLTCPDLDSTLTAAGMSPAQRASFVSVWGGLLTDPVQLKGNNP